MRGTAVLLLLLAACGRPAEESACPHDPGFDRSGVIRVRADHRHAVLRHDLGLAEIALEAGGSTVRGRPQGLTVVENQLAFQTMVNMETSRGRTCVWFDEVRVDLTPASVSIYVPREYPVDSCEYLAVLEHEREHESAHRERLAAAAVEIERALKDARWLPARGNPLETEDRASAEAALNAKIRKVVTPVYEGYKGDLGRAQAELDRPDLYQWVAKRCAGWK